MKKLLLVLSAILLFSTLTFLISASAISDDSASVQVTADEQTTDYEQILKEYNDKDKVNCTGFLFTDFGEYKGYEVCYGGYDLTQPWTPWARIGNYAFRLNTHINCDKQLLGLCLIKDGKVTRLEDAYISSVVDNDDMDKIINIIMSNEAYKRYFNIYDIFDIKVCTTDDYTIRYEGINDAPSQETAQKNLTIGEYNLYVLKYCDFVPNGSTKGLYVVDKEGKEIDFEKAYENGLLGTADEVVNMLNNNEFSQKDYWKIKKDEGTTSTVATTSPEIPTETVTMVPTEPNPTVPHSTTTTVKPVEKKKTNTVKVTVKNKTVKAKKLKNKKQTVKPLTIKNARGKVLVTLVRKGTSKKILSKITVSKNGAVTLKKGNYKKGTYKVQLRITAKGNSKYKSKIINKTVKVTLAA